MSLKGKVIISNEEIDHLDRWGTFFIDLANYKLSKKSEGEDVILTFEEVDQLYVAACDLLNVAATIHSKVKELRRIANESKRK